MTRSVETHSNANPLTENARSDVHVPHGAEEHCVSSTKFRVYEAARKDLLMTLPQPNEPIEGSTHSFDGGGAGDCYQPGGYGGGKIAIATALLALDGTIAADGAPATLGGCSSC